MRVLVAGSVALVLVTAGIALNALRDESSPAETTALAWTALRNATYPSSLQRGTVALRDGLLDEPAAPGSAARLIVRLTDFAAFGDLDGDRLPDAAVVLTTSAGGTGTFVDLAVVRNESGTARPVARTLLGDRVLVRELRIADGVVSVRLRARGSGDPLATLTQEVRRQFRLQGAELIQLGEETQSVPITPPADFVYRPESVALTPDRGVTLVGTLPPGQIASYTVRGEAGQTLDLRTSSQFSNAILSVSGLTDEVTLVSRQEYLTERLVSLRVSQDYAVRVVNLAGHELPYALTMTLGSRPIATPSPTPTPNATPVPKPTATPAAAKPEDRPLAQLSSTASAFLRQRPPIWGIAVVTPSTRTVFTENADEEVPTASVVKLLVMLTVLEHARLEGRQATESEMALLWPMITASDNDSTSQLWEEIGRGAAVASYLRRIGVAGFTPDPARSWGVSYASARAMATVLGKLANGEILDAPSRTIALRLLDNVIPAQRWGAPAGAVEGAQVGVKNGWYPGEEGWRVNSAAVVRPQGGPAYAIAVITNGSPTFQAGIATIEGAARPVNATR